MCLFLDFTVCSPYRFNFHLETVREIVKNAFESLPGDLETVNTLNQELMNKANSDSTCEKELLGDQLLTEIIASAVNEDM